MSTRIGLCLLFFVLCIPASVEAQSDLASMCESWSSCSQKMAEKYEALNAGDVSPGLADEYRDLVDEANDLIKSMRKQAAAELKARPGDGQVIRTMLGIMVHDAQEGRDGQVLESGQTLIDSKINPKYFEQAASIDRLELSQKQVFEELVVRHKEAIADDLPQVKLKTTAGDVVLELYENEAPNTVRNFVSLIESGYYENKLFHRVIENFMAQGGGYETEGLGRGGPGYQIECECRLPEARRNFTGTISMAHAGRDTGGSQFFLNFKHNNSLDRKHTVFGRIISGMDVLEKIERTEVTNNGFERPIDGAKPDKIVSAEVLRKREHSYRVRKKGEPELPEEPVAKKEPAEEKKADDEEESESKDEPSLEPQKKAEPETEKAESEEPEMKEEPKSNEKAEAPKADEKAAEANDEKPAAEEAPKKEESTEASDPDKSDSDSDDGLS